MQAQQQRNGLTIALWLLGSLAGGALGIALFAKWPVFMLLPFFQGLQGSAGGFVLIFTLPVILGIYVLVMGCFGGIVGVWFARGVRLVQEAGTVPRPPEDAASQRARGLTRCFVILFVLALGGLVLATAPRIPW